MTEAEVGRADWPLVAGEAAGLLARAWPVPSLEYTEPYLAWQARFPGGGGVGPVAVAATAGSRMVGFAAATPRRIAWEGRPGWVHLVSFVAVDPEWQGKGIATRLYQSLLGELVACGSMGVVTFGGEGSRGLATLTAAYVRAGFRAVELGTYRTFGMPVRSATLPPPEPIETRPPRLPATPPSGPVLCAWPDLAEWGHQLADPRGASWIPLGTGCAGAIAVVAGRTTAGGSEPFLCVRSLFLDGAVLDGAALRLAAQGLAGAGHCRVVTIPNPQGIEAAELSKAGFRAMPGGFVGRWYLPPGRQPPMAEARTTLEII